MNDITSGLKTKTINFKNVDSGDCEQLTLQLPSLNDYVPKDLKMKSLCDDIYKADSFI